MLEELKFPIGHYQPRDYSPELKAQWLADIRALPGQLRGAVAGLSEEQMQTPYREGGWTIRQIVHHVADANINGYTRYKFGYTEQEPVVRPFGQSLWAEAPDAQSLPAEASLDLLKALHVRWYEFLSQLSDADWNIKVIHPDYKDKLSFWYLLGLYSWHPRHHTAQILECRKRMGW